MRDLKDIRIWISDRKYQVYKEASYPVELSFVDSNEICQAFAGEIVRMTLASLETVTSISSVSRLPRSRAWSVVQWYYAAFYSAHAILRMCGISLTQLETGHISDIRVISGLYGYQCQMQGGLHLARMDGQRLVLENMSSLGGSHEVLWSIFSDFLEKVGRDLLAGGGSSIDIQEFALCLDNLRLVLNQHSSRKGSWLSKIRNQVNYRHQLGVWFPYGTSSSAHEDLLRHATSRRCSAADIEIVTLRMGSTLDSFLSACRYVIALCEDSSLEMKRRATVRRPFHEYGICALRNYANP
ncbi:MAG: hypothetical protein KFB97_01590 [Cyanobium sp. M30B3]|nr:MAG: hypothetical protein KFB97_01590 [Cyanobium sp. M30B3]